MDDEIYSPPSSGGSASPYVSRRKRKQEEGSLYNGVILGLIIDIVGSLVFSFASGIIYGVYLSSTGMRGRRLERYLEKLSIFSPFNMFLIIAGLIISFIAGYVCAKRAGSDSKAAILFLCIIMTIFGGIMSFFGTFSLTQNIILLILSIVAIIVGGWVAGSKSG